MNILQFIFHDEFEFNSDYEMDVSYIHGTQRAKRIKRNEFSLRFHFYYARSFFVVIK